MFNIKIDERNIKNLSIRQVIDAIVAANILNSEKYNQYAITGFLDFYKNNNDELNKILIFWARSGNPVMFQAYMCCNEIYQKHKKDLAKKRLMNFLVFCLMGLKTLIFFFLVSSVIGTVFSLIKF